MVCFATVLEDGLRFLYVAEGLLLLVALQKAQSQAASMPGWGARDSKGLSEGQEQGLEG